ncbi:MAG: signal peptidase I [Planctomycetota bacterium]|nr:signal peptidase I [Planctomycetota bacterium]
MAEEADVIKAAPAKGYARLSPALRGLVADVATGAAGLLALLALFMGSRLEGVWLRIPLLLALLLLLPAAWYAHRRLAQRASPILCGGLVVGLMGCSVLAMALHHASGWTSLAGLASLLAALALRGSVDRAVIRGRDIRPAKRSPLTTLFEQVESLAAALVLVLLVWHFGLEAFRIPSGSMAPTLLGDPISGDRVLVDKFTYAYRDPERWEPVVFRYPLRRTDPYVKRCIALPGEQVLIARGDVYVRLPGNDRIELLRKTPRARDVLWLPIIENLSSNTAWVKNFKRDGDLDFTDGLIELRKRAAVTFPRGDTDDKPGNVTDHDASFGATETPKDRYGRHVVGDLRLQAEVTLEEGGECLVTLVRDEDSYVLELRPALGACKLFHLAEGASRELAIEQTSAIDFGTDERTVNYSLADGELRLEIDGREQFSLDVGTPLLDQLRSRDAEGRINLAGNVALEIAKAEPAGGRQARIEIAGGAEKGATLRIRSIDRDVYYVGRIQEWLQNQPELPFQVELGDEQYLVLGDNSPGSADCRYWTRITLFLEDDTEVVGSMDEPSQPELVGLLVKAGEQGDPFNAYFKLRGVAHFTPEERGEAKGSDGTVVIAALEQLKEASKTQGRAAIDFYTEGGGYTRIRLADIKHIQVERMPYVERKLFVGRPFAVFLSPRGMKLID